MNVERISEDDPKVGAALDELQGMIGQRWPEASFMRYRGDDPDGMYLDAVVDIDDPDEVMDLVVDRLVEMQVDEGLPVHVVPLQPVDRVIREMKARGRGGEHEWTRISPDRPVPLPR